MAFWERRPTPSPNKRGRGRAPSEPLPTPGPRPLTRSLLSCWLCSRCGGPGCDAAAPRCCVCAEAKAWRLAAVRLWPRVAYRLSRGTGMRVHLCHLTVAVQHRRGHEDIRVRDGPRQGLLGKAVPLRDSSGSWEYRRSVESSCSSEAVVGQAEVVRQASLRERTRSCDMARRGRQGRSRGSGFCWDIWMTLRGGCRGRPGPAGAAVSCSTRQLPCRLRGETG